MFKNKILLITGGMGSFGFMSEFLSGFFNQIASNNAE